MRSHEGDPTRAVRRGDPPGSRASRLAEAGKQLSIALEDVDLDDELDLARALTEAVVAVDRATEHVEERSRDGRQSAGREVPIVARGKATSGSNEGDPSRASGRGDERRRLVQASNPLADEEAGGLQFAGEPDAE